MSAKVTIKDIAQRAHVSVGTVSKVINGDKSVKESNRRAVEEAIAAWDYNVNKVARSLAHRPLKIGILLPSEFKEYYRPMLKGIQDAIEDLSDFKVSAVYERYVDFNDDRGVMESLDRLEKKGVDGIILGPSYVGTYSDRIEKLQKKQIPVVVVMSDMPQSGRIACINVNAALSGQTAADLSRLLLKERESVAVFVGNKDMTEHFIKAGSFQEKAKELDLCVDGVYETHEDSEIAYQLTANLLKKSRELSLIYVATANSVSVCRCIKEQGYQGKVRVIATDILKELEPYIENGTVVAVLEQHLQQQGGAAVNVLYKYLIEGTLNKEETRILPTLLLHSEIRYQMSLM